MTHKQTCIFTNILHGICWCLHVHVCIYMCVFVRVCVCMYVCVSVYVSMRVSVYVSVSICMLSAFVCLCVMHVAMMYHMDCMCIMSLSHMDTKNTSYAMKYAHTVTHIHINTKCNMCTHAYFCYTMCVVCVHMSYPAFL